MLLFIANIRSPCGNSTNATGKPFAEIKEKYELF